ncbi:UPF0149 family protein (plasmid) [Caulobacter sp. ErkDOM-YI]|uniref:UPF0149 family protein n=1 Tax=unclassified Caulobacter TaxID=2648921 RepID=UPI003AF7EBA0
MTLEALEDWFERAKPPVHTAGVSMMDGFLAGVAIGPVFIHPETWLWHLIGDHEKRAHAGTKADAAVQAIVAHYNKISDVLANAPHAYAPIYMRTDEGDALVEDWANGFYGAMRLNMAAWQPLFETFESAAPLMAILVNCTKPDGAPIYDGMSPAIPALELGETWRLIPEAVSVIREQCAQRRAASMGPVGSQ